MLDERSGSSDSDRDPSPGVETDDATLTRPAWLKSVVWIMVGLLFVGPLMTLHSALDLAPTLVIAVALLGIAAVYWVRASRPPKD